MGLFINLTLTGQRGGDRGRCGWIEHISHYLAPRGGRGIGASLHTVFLLAQSGAHRPLIEASFDTAAVRCPSQTEPHPLVRRKEIKFSIKRKWQSKPSLSQPAKGKTNTICPILCGH